MQKAEKRRRQRISSVNLLNYVSLDQNFKEVGQGMGRTINMSETGLLIETSSAVNPEHFLSLNIGLADDRFKVHGEVVYTTSFAGRNYRTGVRFNQAPKDGYHSFQNRLNTLKNDTRLGAGDSENSATAIQIPSIKGPKSDYIYVVDEETYLYGEKIVSQGNFGNWAWVVLDGWATIVRETPKGGCAIYKIGPGGFIGSSMSYLMAHHARTNSVIASENVQLGLLDTQRMTAEHSALSPDFRDILISQAGRLKRIIDRVVTLKLGGVYTKEDLLTGNMIIEPDQKEFGLHTIVRGKTTVLHRDAKGEVPLVNLYPGDYLGSLPFVNNDCDPDHTIVRASTGFEKRELNRSGLLKEYEGLSEPLKNMIEFTTLKILTVSQLAKQITVK